MTARRCVCYNIEFTTLKEIVDRKKVTTINELREEKEFGLSCGFCIPYVEEMMKTGKTEFEPF